MANANDPLSLLLKILFYVPVVAICALIFLVKGVVRLVKGIVEVCKELSEPSNGKKTTSNRASTDSKKNTSRAQTPSNDPQADDDGDVLYSLALYDMLTHDDKPRPRKNAYGGSEYRAAACDDGKHHADRSTPSRTERDKLCDFDEFHSF